MSEIIPAWCCGIPFVTSSTLQLRNNRYEADDDDDDMEEDTQTAEEYANELALLAEDAKLDVSALKSGAHLKKNTATGGAAAAAAAAAALAAPPKRKRRLKAIQAQNRFVRLPAITHARTHARTHAWNVRLRVLCLRVHCQARDSVANPGHARATHLYVCCHTSWSLILRTHALAFFGQQ